METWTVRYTEIKIENFIAEISSVAPYYGFSFDVDFDLLSPIHQKWIEKYDCSSINCERGVRQVYRIIEYVAKNIK